MSASDRTARNNNKNTGRFFDQVINSQTECRRKDMKPEEFMDPFGMFVKEKSLG